MKIQYLGFIPAIIAFIYLIRSKSGRELLEFFFMVIGAFTIIGIIILGIQWGLS
jgi:hypothetical protein